MLAVAVYTVLSSLSIAYNTIIIYVVWDLFKPNQNYFWDALVYTGFVMSCWGLFLHLMGIGTACNAERSPPALVCFVKFSYLVHVSILTFGLLTFVSIALFSDNRQLRDNMYFYIMLVGPGAIGLYPAWLLYILTIIPKAPHFEYSALRTYGSGLLFVTAH